MSVSFEQLHSKDVDFDSLNYLTMICEKTKVDTRSCVNAQFPQGWKYILDRFINSIKDYPVKIIHIHDTYTVLDIKFVMEQSTDEVYVWRAVEKARRDSTITCKLCGDEMICRRISHFEMHCDLCRKASGKTQTWLDKY